MSTLTDDQLSDFQRDLGIVQDDTIFSDSELNRLFTRAEGDYDLAVCYAIDQLMMDAAKFNDYSAGSSRESKSQVFDHLQKMRAHWGSRAGVGYGELRAGVLDYDFQEKGD